MDAIITSYARLVIAQERTIESIPKGLQDKVRDKIKELEGLKQKAIDDSKPIELEEL